MSRFQKREKLRELNKMFEANKGKFDNAENNKGFKLILRSRAVIG